MKEEKAVQKTLIVSGKKKRAAGISPLLKKVIGCVTAFLVALTLTGCSLFPGVYPFGVALVSALSSLPHAISAYTGALLGSAFIPTLGGAYAIILTLTLIVRVLLSLYLNYDELPEWFRQSRKRSAELSDYSQNGEGRRENPQNYSPRSPTNKIAAVGAKNDVKPDGSNRDGTVLRFDTLSDKILSLHLFTENVRVRLALSGAAALFCGAWSVVLGGFEYYDLFGAVFSLFVTPVFTYLLYAATDRHMRSSVVREIGVYFTLAALTLSLHRLGGGGIFSFDFGMSFAMLSCVLVTSKFGIYRGLVCALACGMAIEPGSIPTLAAAVLFQVAFEKLSVPLALCASCASASAYGILVGGLEGFISVFPPSVIACAVALPLIKGKVNILPQKLFGSEIKTARASVELESSRESAKVYRKRLSELSQSLISASYVMQGIADRLRKPRSDELYSIVSCAFDRYCGLCRNRVRCASRVEELKKAMSRSLAECGEVGASEVPTSVATICYNIGRIIDEINASVALKVSGMREGDFLGVAAEDMAAIGELLCRMDASLTDEFREDRELSSKLTRLLSCNNFHASGVKVLGGRRKRVYVGDIELSSTRMGGDDIRRLIEQILGGRFTQPEFSLDGAALSMRLESERLLILTSGTYSIAASSVQMYCKDNLNENLGADCGGDESEGEGERRIEITDEPPAAEKRGDGVSGDGIITFEAEGRQYMILSDGMGSGREASVASGMALNLLKKYIEGGAELESALKLLNRILRSAGRECSATIDICEVDLYTSEARFIKSGAAPSFVLRGGSIFRLQSKTVPIGIIRALDAEMIKFDVEPGDTVVMVSDGAARSYDEAPWLLDMMTSDEVVMRGDERLAAMSIVSEAALRGSKDDITCGIMRVKGLPNSASA